MSGRSGYGRSKIVGKLINLPANMMMAGLAPRVGKPGWAIRLYWRRVDECFCLCEPCILEEQGVILPPTILPPPNPGDPPNPGLPPTLPPTIPPFEPPTLPGGGGLRPFATEGAVSSGMWPVPINYADNDTTVSSGQWIIAQFSRPVTVIGGTSYGKVDISFNNYGPWLHGEDAKNNYPGPGPPLYLNLNWKQIAKDTDVYKLGFGYIPGSGLIMGTTGSFPASAVYISENLPQSGFCDGAPPLCAPGGFGANPIQPTGRLDGQWIIFDISGALASVGTLEGIGLTGGIGGAPGIPSTVNGRKAIMDYANLNSISAIQYNPGLFSGSVADTGLLYAQDCSFPGGVLGPLAGFNSPPKLTLYG